METWSFHGGESGAVWRRVGVVVDGHFFCWRNVGVLVHSQFRFDFKLLPETLFSGRVSDDRSQIPIRGDES